MHKLYTSVTDATRKTYLAIPISRTLKNVFSSYHKFTHQIVLPSDYWAIFKTA